MSPGGWAVGDTDPQVTLDRRRTLTPPGLVETMEVASRAQERVELTLYVDLSTDLAPMAASATGGTSATADASGETHQADRGRRRDDRGLRAWRSTPAPTTWTRGVE